MVRVAKQKKHHHQYTPKDPKASDETMEMMAERAEQIKRDERSPFVLLVMTRTGKIWQQVESFCSSFSRASVRKRVKETGLVVMLPEVPPRPLLDSLGCAQENSRIAFVVGESRMSEDLIAAGVQLCTVLVVFPTLPPTWQPSGDQDAYFLLKQIEGINLKRASTAVIELSSGKAGAHIMPNMHHIRDAPAIEKNIAFPPEPENMEEHFSSWFVAGQAFTPQSITGMLANTFYCFGLLEVVQALTVDSFSHDYQPEQVCLPQELIGLQYKDVVERLLSVGNVGPHPTLVLGILRTTPLAKCVLIHPSGDMVTQDDDILIVLAHSLWMDWAEQQDLVCLAGLPLSKIVTPLPAGRSPTIPSDI